MKSIAVLLFTLLSLPLRADQWAYFKPEMVTHFSCTVSAMTTIMLNPYGVNETPAQWVAEAHAEYVPPSSEKWAMELGVFPLSLKGRHQAEKVCSQWFDQASKRIKAAHQKG